ncbi:M28 family metallopeptidase [Chryseobacterium suipulveris]|uniref:M28 family metallopeptidase n=1 Tax=Chryseobacterium suipulveris TaxID=2929800 RepID=A0ABY4BLH2_9FLAO|nr:M28 family metallopeptidase [Chryseobacterium suipulveris]UOE40041.1 M28 family metallopeptidase [Chryseobacterium suipulveris]
MKKLLLPLFAGVVLSGCATNLSYTGSTFKESYKSITANELKTHLYIVASDEMQGRNTGSEGQKKAGRYLISQYQKMGVSHPKQMNSYYQIVPKEALKGRRGELPESENILAFIEGTEKPEEVIVISAHYDHVGVQNGEIYNGADDDGSGTVALLEIAQAFQMAKKMGKSPKRSVLFLHVTGEEHGLLGSKYYSDNPIFPLANTVANLNIDMIGRCDKDNCGKDYVYVIGSEMLSTELKKINEYANSTNTKLELNYKYDDPKDPQRLYYRSDHYNFAKHGIPVAFYFDGIHEDYHKPTDDPEKIDYDALQKRTQLVFATAWELANRRERIVVDRK